MKQVVVAMPVIYVVTCDVSGKKYIGQTIQGLDRRRLQHESAARQGGTSAFCNALRKYGFQNFRWEVLEEVDAEGLNDREIALIQHYSTICPNGYNLHPV